MLAALEENVASVFGTQLITHMEPTYRLQFSVTPNPGDPIPSGLHRLKTHMWSIY